MAYTAYISPYEIRVVTSSAAADSDEGQEVVDGQKEKTRETTIVDGLMSFLPRQFYRAIKPHIDDFNLPIAVPDIVIYGDKGVSNEELQMEWRSGLEAKLQKLLSIELWRQIADFFDSPQGVLVVGMLTGAHLFSDLYLLTNNVLVSAAATLATCYALSKVPALVANMKYGSERPVAVQTLLGAKIHYTSQG